MAKFEWRPLGAKYLIQLEQLGAKTEEVAGKALYAGANIVADEIRKNMNALKTQKGWPKQGEVFSGIPEPQKQGLQDSFGISPMKKDDSGNYNVKLGFDGYNEIKTKMYPNGQPNQLVARSVEKGTSFMERQPFVEPAVKKVEKQAEVAMQKVIDEEAAKIMK